MTHALADYMHVVICIGQRTERFKVHQEQGSSRKSTYTDK